MRLQYFLEARKQIESLCWGLESSVGGHLIFRSFAGDGGKASIRAIPFADAADIFETNQYREIVLSLGPKPLHEMDWGFMEREARQLVVVDGGRQSGQTLELSEMRVFTKESEGKALFRQLKKKILSYCTIRGVYTKTGVFYKSIYCSPGVAGLNLTERLHYERPSSHYTVSAPDH